jgi:hypothetical protein
MADWCELAYRHNVGFGEEWPASANGRLPTDAILRPVTAFRSIAVGQARRLTSPAE